MTTPAAPDAAGRVRPFAVGAWTLATVAAVVGSVTTLVRPLAPAVPELTTPLTSFPAATLQEVAAWVGPLRTAFVLRLLLSVAVPLLLVLWPPARRTIERLAAGRLPTLRAAATVALLSSLALLPLRWWTGWVHAGEFGFRTSSALRWWTETAGQLLLGVAVTVGGAMVLLWAVRRFPRDLAAVGTLAATTLTALLVLVQPWIVARLLYDPQPLDDPALAARIDEVVARTDLEEVALYEANASVRTTRVNALVTGIGPSRQVLLWDTLLELPDDRVVAVVGHELAHAEHRDVARSVLATATGTFALLLPLQLWWRRRPAGVHAHGARAGAAAVAAVLVVQVVAVPVVGWTSRRQEAAADHRTLELVRDPAAFVELARGFVLDDLADPDPPGWVRWLTTHPTVDQRIERAVSWARERGAPVPGDQAAP